MNTKPNKISIYSSYGIIMKELQNTELLLIQTIYSISLKRGRIKNAEKAMKIYSNRLKDTFGKLLNILDDLNADSDLQLSAGYFEEIEKIKRLRDYYAHSFFKEFASFDSQELIEDIFNRNKFAFNTIKTSNISLQNGLRGFLKTMNYKCNEIEKMVKFNSEDWKEIITGKKK